jgi:hypothetical protein
MTSPSRCGMLYPAGLQELKNSASVSVSISHSTAEPAPVSTQVQLCCLQTASQPGVSYSGCYPQALQPSQ